MPAISKGPMLCRLCRQDRELRLSHVIPELLWKPLYRVYGKALSIHRDLPFIRKLGRGIRERLLCDECERVLQEHESYFARVWVQNARLPNDIPENEILIDGLDYVRFKLFHLSILWRAGVAQDPAFYQTDLGPHEQRIRKMILERDPGSPKDYRLFGFVVLRPGTRKVHRGVIAVPTRSRQDGLWVYSAIYGGCVWNIVLSKHKASGFEQDCLTANGKLRLQVVRIENVAGVTKLFAGKTEPPRRQVL